MAAITTFYKLEIQGIVYLVNPTTLRVYTYDLDSPTEIGELHWDSTHTTPTVTLADNWQEIMAAKLAGVNPPLPVL